MDGEAENVGRSATPDGDHGAATEGPVISAKEMKELRRVYDTLCHFADKVHKIDRLNEVKDRLAELGRATEGGQQNAWDYGWSGSGGGQRQHRPSDGSERGVGVHGEAERLEAERGDIEAALRDVRSRPEQHIRPADTASALRSLGQRAVRREVHDMMWEVDEKLDGVVDWEEFRLMFERNVRDTSGLEPASFYHMVQFMIYDTDGNGMVSIDETMNMLYARLGRESMEAIITKLFGGDDGAPIKEVGHQGGEIDFSRYWDVVQKEQVKMFNESELGLTLAEKKQKNKADFKKK